MTIQQALQIFRFTDLNNHTESTLKKAYYHLAQIYHPDKGGSFQQFVALQEAHLLLKKALNKTSYGSSDDYSAQESTSPDFDPTESYNELSQRFDRLRQHYKDLVAVVDKYENIFNNQIKIINGASQDINKYIDHYQNLKENMRLALDRDLLKIKKRFEREWWEYILPTKKLSQDEYVKESNKYVERFNKNSTALDDEFFDQMLRMYRGSFQDLMDLLSDV